MAETMLSLKAKQWLAEEHKYYAHFYEGIGDFGRPGFDLQHKVYQALIDDPIWMIQEAAKNEVIVPQEWYVGYQASVVGTGREERERSFLSMEMKADDYEERMCQKLATMISEACE